MGACLAGHLQHSAHECIWTLTTFDQRALPLANTKSITRNTKSMQEEARIWMLESAVEVVGKKEIGPFLCQPVSQAPWRLLVRQGVILASNSIGASPLGVVAF